VRRFVPDVMIAYFTELGAERIEHIRRTAKSAPHLKILVIASTMAISLVQEVFSVGAQGYLLDMLSREELLSALETMREQRIALDVGLRATVEGQRLMSLSA
jgi:DNA-binding NarL/FixJ family response regulator